MVLARGTNLHGTTPYPSQGLWVTRAATPSPDRADWSPPERLLDTDAPGTPLDGSRGLRASVVPLASARRIVFLTGTRGIGSRWRATRHRLAYARRPAAPGALLPGHRRRRHHGGSRR